jgi:hypothetical protein
VIGPLSRHLTFYNPQFDFEFEPSACRKGPTGTWQGACIWRARGPWHWPPVHTAQEPGQRPPEGGRPRALTARRGDRPQAGHPQRRRGAHDQGGEVFRLQIFRPRRRRLCWDVLGRGRPCGHRRVGLRGGTHPVLLHQRCGGGNIKCSRWRQCRREICLATLLQPGPRETLPKTSSR